MLDYVLFPQFKPKMRVSTSLGRQIWRKKMEEKWLGGARGWANTLACQWRTLLNLSTVVTCAQIDWHLKILHTHFLCNQFPPPILSPLHSTRGKSVNSGYMWALKHAQECCAVVWEVLFGVVGNSCVFAVLVWWLGIQESFMCARHSPLSPLPHHSFFISCAVGGAQEGACCTR